MFEFIVLKLINLLLSLGFLLVARESKKIVGVWLNPSSILSLFWFLYTFFPLIVAFDAPVSPFALVFILCCCASFSLSSLSFGWQLAFRKNKRKSSASKVFNTYRMKCAFYCMCLISSVFILIGIVQQGFSLNSIIANPMELAGEYAGMRYGGELISNVYSQIGLQGCYFTVILGGLIYGVALGNKEKYLAVFLSFLPALLTMMMQSAKGLFFASIFLFMGSILITRIYDNNFELLSRRILTKIFTYATFVFPLVIMSFLSRGLYSADMETKYYRLKFYLVTYSSGHLAAFSDWFSERYFNDSLFHYKQEFTTFGFYTFMSFFRMLGDDREVPMGTYDEFFQYGDYVRTNIYTIFRGLISDYTLVGALLVCLFVGFVCNFFFYKLLCARLNVFYIVFFIFFILVSYQTYIISSLNWITIPFVFVMQCLILFFLLKSNKTYYV